jgi:hypothetical protein
LQNEYKLSIITVNYNGLKDTCALIESIPFNENMEVIVIDNASKEDEASIIAQRYPYIKTIRIDKNLGFAGGNNVGIKKTRGKYLLLINNDTVFKEFNVESLLNRLESSSTIGIVSPKIRFAWGTNPIQYAGYTPLSKITVRNQAIGFSEEDKCQYDTAHPTPYAHGAAMLIKREAINKVGLMPEDYFLYYEEIDWSMMFTRAGYEIWYDPACAIYHKESQSTGQDSPLRTYYITRNRLLLVKRNWDGIYKYLAYCYLTCIVASRNLLKYAFKCKIDHLKAVINGLYDFGMAKYSSIN